MCCRGSGRAGSARQRILRAGAEPSTRRRRAGSARQRYSGAAGQQHAPCRSADRTGSARRRQFSGAAGQQDAPCRGADRAGSTRRRQFSGAAGQQHAPCRSADRAGSARRRRFSGAAAGTPEVAPAPRCCRAARLRWPTVCRSSGGTDFASPRAVVRLLERGIAAVLRELRGTPACRRDGLRYRHGQHRGSANRAARGGAIPARRVVGVSGLQARPPAALPNRPLRRAPGVLKCKEGCLWFDFKRSKFWRAAFLTGSGSRL